MYARTSAPRYVIGSVVDLSYTSLRASLYTDAMHIKFIALQVLAEKYWTFACFDNLLLFQYTTFYTR